MRGDVKGTFAAPTAATSVSAAGPRAGSTRGRVLFYFFSVIVYYTAFYLFYLQEVVEPVGCEGRPV